MVSTMTGVSTLVSVAMTKTGLVRRSGGKVASAFYTSCSVVVESLPIRYSQSVEVSKPPFMLMKSFFSFTIGLSLLSLGLGICCPVVRAQDEARQKITDPVVEDEANPDKKDALSSQYDYVRDVTTVNSRDIYFRTGEKKVSDDGVDFSDNVKLSFWYLYDGEQPKKPLGVMVRLYALGDPGEFYSFSNVYWRMGSSKYSFEVDPDITNTKYTGTLSASALIPTQTFLNWSKLPGFYMKFGAQNRVHHIGAEGMKAMKEVADSIPSTGDVATVAPPKPASKPAKDSKE